MEVEVGRGLAARDMLAAAVDMLAERIGEAEMVEMAAKPARRARRGDRPGQAPAEATRTKSTAPATAANAFLKRADALRLAPLVELGRKRLADPAFDRGDEVRSR